MISQNGGKKGKKQTCLQQSYNVVLLFASSFSSHASAMCRLIDTGSDGFEF